jgi:hypothetical protein
MLDCYDLDCGQTVRVRPSPETTSALDESSTSVPRNTSKYASFSFFHSLLGISRAGASNSSFAGFRPFVAEFAEPLLHSRAQSLFYFLFLLVIGLRGT